MPYVILGGGITGRLAASLWPEAPVLERLPAAKAENLTRLWGTNYLWEPLPGFRCKNFPVTTHVDSAPATEASILAYKNKVGKAAEARDDWGLQFTEKTTGYDLLKVPTCKLVPEFDVQKIDLRNRIVFSSTGLQTYSVLICTLPLSKLVQLVGLMDSEEADRHFPSRPIYIEVVSPPRIQSAEGIYVNYCSDPSTPFYRSCLRDRLLHRESLEELPETKIRIVPGKILRSQAASPILQYLREHDVYCFGRFACWETNELVHETFRKLKAFKETGSYAIPLGEDLAGSGRLQQVGEIDAL